MMREILFRGQTRRKGEKVWMNGEPVLEEKDCGLLFLHLNEVMLNRMLQLGIPSFGR